MIYASFSEMKHIGMTHYKDKGFCSVVAVAAIASVKFTKAYQALKKHGRKHRKGATIPKITNALNSLGLICRPVAFRHKCQTQVLRELPKHGRFLIYQKDHVVAVINGKVIDENPKSKKHVRSVVSVNKKQI